MVLPGGGAEKVKEVLSGGGGEVEFEFGLGSVGGGGGRGGLIVSDGMK